MYLNKKEKMYVPTFMYNSHTLWSHSKLSIHQFLSSFYLHENPLTYTLHKTSPFFCPLPPLFWSPIFSQHVLLYWVQLLGMLCQRLTQFNSKESYEANMYIIIIVFFEVSEKLVPVNGGTIFWVFPIIQKMECSF